MNQDNLKLAELLFPNTLPTPEELENKFPTRNLPEGAIVTRVAPSPTGFMHIGTVYTALICWKLAKQTNGIFFLRLEDTDKKREVEGANQLVIEGLETFHLNFDEGPLLDGSMKGDYGPYIQSLRKEIYQSFAKKWIIEGKAYPCFATPEELEEITNRQNQMKLKPGYYKEFAVWRNKSFKEVEKALEQGLNPVIRFRNEGHSAKRFKVQDLIKGKSELPENDNDIVILKSDGIPTYHFAHLIDDHLMRTTHVIRGDEWYSSLALHLQLFQAAGWEAPKYAHIAPIQKLENDSRRKLSKRKDPEAGITYYFEEGFPIGGILDYLLTIADSNFEPWRRKNPSTPFNQYNLEIKNLGRSGALLDFQKLNHVCTLFMSQLMVEEIYDLGLKWANQYDIELQKLMTENKNLWLSIFSMEKGNLNQRKDLSKWSMLKSYYGFFFDQIYQNLKFNLEEFLPNIEKKVKIEACQKLINSLNLDLGKDAWLENIKNIAFDLNFAKEVKEYKQEPDKYLGHFGEITQIYRIILTGRPQSPDLYEIMKVLGKDKVIKRLETYLNS